MSESFDPHTVVYMYDVAFSPDQLETLGKIWNNRYIMICLPSILAKISRHLLLSFK